MKRPILIALALVMGVHALPTTGLADGTFDTVCASCHTGGIRGMIAGAPNVNRTKTWQPYLAEHSVDQMLRIVLYGTAEHKARGGCDGCTDQQINEALEYLLSVVQ